MSGYQRHAAGTPSSMGGRFKAHQHGEANLSGLGMADEVPLAVPHLAPTAEQWDNRVRRLMGQGFIPPAALDAERSDTASAKGAIREDVREDWWDRQQATAERGHADGDYAHMPDDNTPGMTYGQASSGHRRTHRMNYRGAGVSLRMPSATAIKRFADQSNRKTFDVPVTAEYPAGSVQGWVRVTQGADGQWGTHGLNFTPADEAYVGEGVRAVLEGRRPSHALAEAGDLIKRRREREASEGAVLRPVRSSWVKEVGRDEATGTTVITTKRDDKAYGWATSHAAYVHLAKSQSPGAEVNNMKRYTAGREMINCTRCHRVYSAAAAHRCRAEPESRSGESIESNQRTIGLGLRAAFRRAGRRGHGTPSGQTSPRSRRNAT